MRVTSIRLGREGWALLSIGALLAGATLNAQERANYVSDVRISISKAPPPAPAPARYVSVKGAYTIIEIRRPEPLPAFRIADYLDMDEQQLTAHMASRDSMEILLARQAQSNVADPRVREYAAAIERDRSASLIQTLDVVMEEGVGASARASDYDLARLQQLLSHFDTLKSGPAWDAAFLRTQFFIHQNEIDVLSANIKNAHDDDLEDVIEDKLEILTRGRETARLLAHELGVSLP